MTQRVELVLNLRARLLLHHSVMLDTDCIPVNYQQSLKVGMPLYALYHFRRLEVRAVQGSSQAWARQHLLHLQQVCHLPFDLRACLHQMLQRDLYRLIVYRMYHLFRYDSISNLTPDEGAPLGLDSQYHGRTRLA